jgi:hypothetical protein
MDETEKIREYRNTLINKHGKEKAHGIIKAMRDNHNIEHIRAMAYDNTGSTSDKMRMIAFASLNPLTKEQKKNMRTSVGWDDLTGERELL